METLSNERCPWCGHEQRMVWVHSHGQCGVCGTNYTPCCQGVEDRNGKCMVGPVDRSVFVV